MSFRQLAALFIGIMGAGAPTFAAAPVSSYTLEQVLNLALEKNPDILSAKQEIEKSYGVVITARARLYPQVNGSGSIGYTQGDVFQQGTDSTQYSLHDTWNLSLTVTHSLYSAGVNRNTINIADLQRDNAFINLQVVMDDTLLTVKQTFYSILLHYNEIAVEKQNIQSLIAERDHQQQLFDAGRSTKFNVLRIEVNLANEQPILLQDQNDLINDEIKLSQLLGTRWDPASDQPPFYIKGSMECPPVKANLDSLIGEALARRPELKRATNQIDINKSQIDIARASNIPRFDAFVSGGASEEDRQYPGFFSPSANVAFGVLGRWDIFDGYAGKGRAITGEASLQQARIQQDALHLSIAADVRQAYNSLDQARLTLKALSENVKRAEKALELARLSQETGYATVLDVLQSTVDLARARNSENEARYRYLTSLAGLERAVSLKADDWGLDEHKPVAMPPLPNSENGASTPSPVHTPVAEAQLRQEANP